MSSHRDLRLASRGAAALLAAAFAAGCARPLAVQHEYFAPASGTIDRSSVATQHLVSHHRALQTAQRWCAAAAASGPVPRAGAELPGGGPELGDAAAREALERLCAGIPPRRAVAAYGPASDAYRRWVEDQVRELQSASETAASAAGGS